MSSDVRRYDGTTSWWPAAERRWRLCAISKTGTQSAYRGAVPMRQRRVKMMTFYLTRSRTSSQWRLSCKTAVLYSGPRGWRQQEDRYARTFGRERWLKETGPFSVQLSALMTDYRKRIVRPRRVKFSVMIETRGLPHFQLRARPTLPKFCNIRSPTSARKSFDL